eukprot:711904-Pyramimonas_sp.AAC.1
MSRGLSGPWANASRTGAPLRLAAGEKRPSRGSPLRSVRSFRLHITKNGRPCCNPGVPESSLRARRRRSGN